MGQVMNRSQCPGVEITRQSYTRRPPWALSELQFVYHCSRCHACVQTCPEQILVTDARGYPEVDFSRGRCTFCHRCVDSCEREAFYDDLDKFAWQLRASISARCLDYQHIHCEVCKEQCLAGAISFRHQKGVAVLPQIDSQRCNGCGGCYQSCPAGAISLDE